jgi:outer membrane protein assembly factor BamB
MAPRKRLMLLTTALLIAGLAFLAIYHYKNRGRRQGDPALLQELQGATLPPMESVAVTAADWPGWRGPLRDAVSRETGLRSDWPNEGLPVVWKAPAGTGYSSMAMAGGRLYTMLRRGDDEQIVCLDAKTGEQRWLYGYPIQYSNGYGGGPRSTPAVAGDRVYAVGATGILSCVDAQTGKMIWDHNLLREFNASNLQWGVSFSPLVDGNLVYAIPGGAGGNSLAAFDKADGHLVWHSGDDPGGYSSPILTTAAGTRQLLCLTGTALVSVSPETGQLFWRFPWNTDHLANIATPLVRGDYVFISSGYGKGCALLKITARQAGDVARPAGDVSPPLEARPVYQTNEFRDHHSGSVLWGEHIYGFDEHRLTCLDFRDGSVCWQKSGLGQGTLLAADGHLVILSENGKVVLAEANPEKYREKASFKFSGARCWTLPVLADGRLYVRDEEKIVCYDLRKNPK